MPAKRSRSLIDDGRVNFRETPDVVGFYRKCAAERRLSLSEYVRTLAARGALSESIDEFVATLRETLNAISTEASKSGAARRSPVSGQTANFPEEVYRAIFACHFMLRESLSPNDMTLTRRANDYAAEEISKLRERQS